MRQGAGERLISPHQEAREERREREIEGARESAGGYLEARRWRSTHFSTPGAPRAAGTAARIHRPRLRPRCRRFAHLLARAVRCHRLAGRTHPGGSRHDFGIRRQPGQASRSLTSPYSLLSLLSLVCSSFSSVFFCVSLSCLKDRFFLSQPRAFSFVPRC